MIKTFTDSPISKAEPDPILAHLMHPYSLDNLSSVLKHIQRFRVSLDNAPLNDDTLLMARHVLADLIEYSPVNVAEFAALLDGFKEHLSKHDGTASKLI